MVYMGGKFRIRNKIIPFIQKEVNNANGYYEPFCGGCNVIELIKHDKRVAADRSPWLIEFWNNLDKIDQLPRTLTREEYSRCRDLYNEGKIDWYIAAIGFLGSFGGRFYDGGYMNADWTSRIKNVKAQINGLHRVSFVCADYKDTPKLENWVFYCDPPYEGTKGYKEELVYDEFWNWCEDMSKRNTVFISEQNSPIGEVVWEKPVKRTIGEKTKSAIEKLYRINRKW